MANSNYHEENRPVRDLGVPPVPRSRPKAGAGNQGDARTRKNDLLNTGTVGHVPGNSGTGRRSSARAGYVEETAPKSTGPIRFGVVQDAARRPMPREIPMYSEPTHTGTRVRFLDGHTEIHFDRPRLVEDLNDPDMADYHDDIRNEVTARDAFHGHRFW